MIKNIVFDMGKVLLHYDGSRVCRHFIKDEAMQREIHNAIFISPEWLLLDMGLISEEAGIQQICSRLDSEEAKEKAHLCFEHWIDYNLWPVEGMKELIVQLKEQGYRIYLCSNASIRMVKHCQLIPGIEYFDGILFSAEEKCMKPQKEIYHRLFEKFQLNPKECFFIDDLSINIESAKACGMDGYCFFDGDVKRLKKALDGLNKEG